jgi:hypothetical protein
MLIWDPGTMWMGDILAKMSETSVPIPHSNPILSWIDIKVFGGGTSGWFQRIEHWSAGIIHTSTSLKKGGQWLSHKLAGFSLRQSKNGDSRPNQQRNDLKNGENTDSSSEHLDLSRTDW